MIDKGIGFRVLRIKGEIVSEPEFAEFLERNCGGVLSNALSYGDMPRILVSAWGQILECDEPKEAQAIRDGLVFVQKLNKRGS